MPPGYHKILGAVKRRNCFQQVGGSHVGCQKLATQRVRLAPCLWLTRTRGPAGDRRRWFQQCINQFSLLRSTRAIDRLMVDLSWLRWPTPGGGRIAEGLLHSYYDPPRVIGKGADSKCLAPLAGLVGKEGVDVGAKNGFEVVFRFLNFEPVSERESSRPRGFWNRR